MQNAAVEAGKSDFATLTPSVAVYGNVPNARSVQVSLTDHPIILQITPSTTPTPSPTPSSDADACAYPNAVTGQHYPARWVE